MECYVTKIDEKSKNNEYFNECSLFRINYNNEWRVMSFLTKIAKKDVKMQETCFSFSSLSFHVVHNIRIEISLELIHRK